MQYRRFGRTDLNTSVFSLGTMRCAASQANATETIGAALARGINHFETAQGYGNSEFYLGMAINQLRVRETVHVTTKITPQPNALLMAQFIDDSLSRLNIGWIDCLAIHGVNTPEHLAWVLDEKGCMAAVREAIADQKIGSVGFSTHGSLDIILAAIESDQFDFVNLHYNFFFQRNELAVQAAKKKDMGVFIISPADKGGKLYEPPETLKTLCHPFDPLLLLYRFLLSQTGVSTLSLGPANASELDWSLQVQDDTMALTPHEIELLDALQTSAIKALGDDFCAQCHACLPCPEEINIPEILRLRNLAIAYDMKTYGEYRYQMFERAGHWFPGRLGARCTDCGDCLPRCPSNLDIADLVKDAHQRLHQPTRLRLWDGLP